MEPSTTRFDYERERAGDALLRFQNPFCARSTKSQASDSPPNRFSTYEPECTALSELSLHTIALSGERPWPTTFPEGVAEDAAVEMSVRVDDIFAEA